jgi:hypothetical protein
MVINGKPLRGKKQYYILRLFYHAKGFTIKNILKKVVCRNFQHTTFTSKYLKLEKSKFAIYITLNFIPQLIPFSFILYHASFGTNKKPTNLLLPRKQLGASR